jgi:Fe-S cluster assembly protein SufD
MMIDQLLTLTQDTIVQPTNNTRFILDVSQCSQPVTFHVQLQEQGVACEVLALYRLRDGQQVQLTTVAEHLVPNTSCFSVVKAVLEDNTYSDYIGKILIRPDASETTSYLSDNVLVTGTNVKNNSQPILEIENNNVKASHGATTGRVSKEHLYYLTSRGLTVDEATSLILEGFFLTEVNKIEDEGIKSKVLEFLCLSI